MKYWQEGDNICRGLQLESEHLTAGIGCRSASQKNSFPGHWEYLWMQTIRIKSLGTVTKQSEMSHIQRWLVVVLYFKKKEKYYKTCVLDVALCKNLELIMYKFIS